MEKTLKYFYLFVVISAFFTPSTHAAVAVYTDRLSWEAAVQTRPTGHFHDQNFEAFPTGTLSSGSNNFHPFYVDIPGAPGVNAIDNSLTPDPYSDALSPNGSNYYLGDVNAMLSFFDYPDMFQVTGFGADWVFQGDLVIEVQGTSISFNTYLPSGTGFLGIITDRPEETLFANLSGDAVFGADEIYTGNIEVPIPAAIWLFCSGALGLLAAARTRKTS